MLKDATCFAHFGFSCLARKRSVMARSGFLSIRVPHLDFFLKTLKLSQVTSFVSESRNLD